MDPSCSTCVALVGPDRCPFHTDGSRKRLSTVAAKGAVETCPQCGQADIDPLDGFYDTENRAWHATCAVIALRAF
ncbi:MAG TPA: hypothetical protein VF997_02285 [Polyangia bacterium]